VRETGDGYVEQTYIVVASVRKTDEDLLKDGSIESIIRARFEGTAVRIIECEPQKPKARPRHIVDADIDRAAFRTDINRRRPKDL
jgi:hypothetical protein